MHDNLHRVTDIVKIIERLPHAHKDDIGQHAAIGGVMADIFVVLIFIRRRKGHISLWPFAKRIACEHHLTNDFAGRQIAHQPHRAGMAEPAIERAANLARNTQSPAIRIGDEHHLIILRIIGTQKPFARAVCRHLRLDHFWPANDKTVGEPRPHRFGNIGHRLKIGHAAMVNPMEHLLGPQLCRLFIQLRFFKQLPNLEMAQPHEVNASITTRRNGARSDYRVDMAGNLHNI